MSKGDFRSQFGVMSIPTIMVFKNGEAVATSVGAKSKAELVCIVRLKNIEKACEKQFRRLFVCYKISGVIECLLPKNL